MPAPLRQLPWDQITEAHLQALITDGVREGRLIEYKRDLYEPNDAGSREFLADVCSFANADGGHLLVGVDEEDGIPTELVGIAVTADTLIPALDSRSRDGIDPRILGVTMRTIDLANGRSVLLLRIPQSWNRPHMVTFKNLSRCYGRNNGGKYQMDMAEIRKVVMGGSAIADRIAAFRRSRIDAIASDVGPVPSNGRPMIVLHAIPFLSLELGGGQALPDRATIYNYLRPLGGSGWSDRINLDGILTFSSTSTEVDTYLQLFRQGMVETADFYMLRPTGDSRYMHAECLDEKIEESVASIIGLLGALDISPPVAWLLTLKGVKGYEIQVANAVPFVERPLIDRDELLIPEALDEDMSLGAAAIAQLLMDPVWQAAGWPHSKTFERRNRQPQ